MQELFEPAAYDAREAGNPIMQRLRQRSWRVLDAAFPAPSTVLDVGAGTGTDALRLAGRGHRVVACEPSPAMLEHLSAKARGAGLDIPVHCLPASRVGELCDVYGSASFDGAVSSFGALNLEPDLDLAVAGLARLVRSGGHLVASVLNRWAAAESLGNLVLLRPVRAARRLRGYGTFQPQGSKTSAPVRYDTLRSLRRSLRPHFAIERCEALAFASPPPSALRQAARMPRLASVLERVDDAAASRWPANRLGNHLLVTARRV